MTVADRAYLGQALALAALAETRARPNPRVGCVVVRDGTVVGRGFHVAPGRAHAEVEALDQAGDSARGATLYVNLEPCAHHGRTPPCVDRIVAAGISAVVASVQDPNPLVDGRGFAKLRDAGVRVDVGLLAEEARRLNAPFLHWHASGRPRVTLKVAVSLDGRSAAAGGASRWITGTAARRFAHRLRLRHDAVIVGAGTVRIDDPSLDVRLPGVEAEHTPLRVVVGGTSPIPGCAKVFGGARRARVYAATGAAAGLADLAEVVNVADRGGRVDLAEMLEDLGRIGVQSVLVEGGAALAGQFVARGLVDDLAVFVAPTLMGDLGGRPLAEFDAPGSPAGAVALAGCRRLALGSDTLWLATLRDEPEGGRRACSPA